MNHNEPLVLINALGLAKALAKQQNNSSSNNCLKTEQDYLGVILQFSEKESQGQTKYCEAKIEPNALESKPVESALLVSTTTDSVYNTLAQFNPNSFEVTLPANFEECFEGELVEQSLIRNGFNHNYALLSDPQSYLPRFAVSCVSDLANSVEFKLNQLVAYLKQVDSSLFLELDYWQKFLAACSDAFASNTDVSLGELQTCLENAQAGVWLTICEVDKKGNTSAKHQIKYIALDTFLFSSNEELYQILTKDYE